MEEFADYVMLITNTLDYKPFEELVDINEELQRLEKEKNKILEEKEWVDRTLSNEGFLKKAPASKVEEIKNKNKEMNDKLDKIENRIKQLNEM